MAQIRYKGVSKSDPCADRCSNQHGPMSGQQPASQSHNQQRNSREHFVRLPLRQSCTHMVVTTSLTLTQVPLQPTNHQSKTVMGTEIRDVSSQVRSPSGILPNHHPA